MRLYPPDAQIAPSSSPQPVASAVAHALFWLVFANAIGVLIAILLLFPALNRLLCEWTYGRWIMVHMNLELYGWTSLPLAGFLFKIYGADRGPLGLWCRPVLWAWSAALAVGAFSWLSGFSSGKLFLDWSGFARVFFAAGHACSLAVARCCVCPRMEGHNSFCARCKDCRTFASAGGSLHSVRCVQSELLSRHQSRHGRSNRRQPA